MKHKRIIKIKNPKLQRIRNQLRKVWLAATTPRFKKYFAELETIEKTERGYWRKNISPKQKERMIKLTERQQKLNHLIDKSICTCPLCNATTKDMIYNKPLDEWYCTDCFQGMIDFYYDTKKKLAKGQFFDDFNEEFYKTFLD